MKTKTKCRVCHRTLKVRVAYGGHEGHASFAYLPNHNRPKKGEG